MKYILEELFPDDLKKYALVSTVLSELIMKKYEDANIELFGNIRMIKERFLGQNKMIKMAQVSVLYDNYKVSTINDLTQLLEILRKFEINLSELSEELKERYRNSNIKPHQELDDLIGPCWLIAATKDQDVRMSIEANNKSKLLFYYGSTGVSCKINTTENNIITELKISNVYDNTRGKSHLSFISNQRQYVLEYFNQFIINADEKTVK
jgi:hypothetical protein